MRVSVLNLLALCAVLGGLSYGNTPPRSNQSQSTSTSPDIPNLRAKAEAGDAEAQVAIGRAYRDGQGVEQSAALAAQWFRKSADQGNAAAQNDLGILYSSGQGVERDKQEAVRWYLKAAKRGNAKAMFNLGASYYNGDGVGADEVQSYAWFLLAQENGSVEANDAVSRSAIENKFYEPAAYTRVGDMYQAGAVPPNMSAALKWYRKAADMGDQHSSVQIAVMLLNHGPNTTAEEYAESRRRCERAAKTDFAGAYCLVVIYRKGLGIEKSPAESDKWLARAAEMGHRRAALELGEAYWKGDGVKQDYVNAYMWVWIAYNSKVPGSEQDELAISKEMKAKDVQRAKKRADDWLRGHPSFGLIRHDASASSN